MLGSGVPGEHDPAPAHPGGRAGWLGGRGGGRGGRRREDSTEPLSTSGQELLCALTAVTVLLPGISSHPGNSSLVRAALVLPQAGRLPLLAGAAGAGGFGGLRREDSTEPLSTARQEIVRALAAVTVLLPGVSSHPGHAILV